MVVASREAGAAELFFLEAEALDLRPHGPVEDEDALIRRGPESREDFGTIRQIRGGSGSGVGEIRHEGRTDIETRILC